MAVNIDNCEHGIPEGLCRRCNGNDPSNPVVPSNLGVEGNPDNNEKIKIADRVISDGLAEKTAGVPGGCPSSTVHAMATPPPRGARLEKAEDMLTAALPPIAKIAELLGGDVRGGQVLCPGPGHSAGDRSLSVKPDPDDREGFVTHSFAGDGWKDCRDHVRTNLSLPDPKSERRRRPAAASGACSASTSITTKTANVF